MKRLTFERAILVVLILIILVSTSESTIKFANRYIDKFINKDSRPNTDTTIGKSSGFPTMLSTADSYFKERDYEAAAQEYFTLSLNTAFSTEQKIHVYFRLGLCQYYMGKYDMASNSFSKAASFSTNDSVAYNNAAVSAYKANNITKAIELQNKALSIMPAVEYYYNLGRMYEDNEEYDQAANSFLAVAIGESNITKIERIDPVRVKEKVTRLFNKNKPSDSNSTNNGLIAALKLRDSRDILTIDESDMQLKQGEFVVNVENKKDSKNIIAEYDREKYDPYNLISNLIWTIYKDGKEIYKKSSEKINFNIKDSGNYEVGLSIRYNGNKELVSSKTVRIKGNQAQSPVIIDNVKHDPVVVKPAVNDDIKINPFAVYEQLFASDFKINISGYTDKYSVVWGKDEGVETSFNKKIFMSKGSSLVISNTSDKEAGLWINLDSLLADNRLKGKNVRISFYARQITDNADLNISVRVKSNNLIATTNPLPIALPFQFKQQTVTFYVPEDATGITASIKTRSLEEFNIDGFTIAD